MTAPLGKRLILFDIDGTLLSCGPQVRPLFGEAMEVTYGTTGDLDGHEFAGKTDDQIVTELLAGEGVAPSLVRQGLPRMRSEYHARLERGLDASRMRLLPGVRSLLELLASSPGVGVGLLTGNWERCARVKLSRLGLNEFFAFGAFGDGRVDRRDLPPVALDRAAEVLGLEVTSADTLIVGDTPLDVACAHAHGIECLAVATGGASYETLEAAGAARVCHNLAMLQVQTHD